MRQLVPRVPKVDSGWLLVAAIGGVLLLGFVAKQGKWRERFESVSEGSLRRVVSARLSDAGTGTVGLNRLQPEKLQLEVAAWMKINYHLSSGANEVGTVMVPFVRDDGGNPWPFECKRAQGSLFLMVPKGYGKVPKRLRAGLQDGDREWLVGDFPPLPAPRPLREPKTTAAWAGLEIEPVRLKGGASKIGIRVHDRNSSNVLIASVIGSSASDREPPSTLAPLPGAEKGILVTPRFHYPKEAKSVYLRVQSSKESEEQVTIPLSLRDLLNGCNIARKLNNGTELSVRAVRSAPGESNDVLFVLTATGPAVIDRATLRAPALIGGHPPRLTVNGPRTASATLVPSAKEELSLDVEYRRRAVIREATVKVRLDRPPKRSVRLPDITPSTPSAMMNAARPKSRGTVK